MPDENRHTGTNPGERVRDAAPPGDTRPEPEPSFLSNLGADFDALPVSFGDPASVPEPSVERETSSAGESVGVPPPAVPRHDQSQSVKPPLPIEEQVSTAPIVQPMPHTPPQPVQTEGRAASAVAQPVIPAAFVVGDAALPLAKPLHGAVPGASADAPALSAGPPIVVDLPVRPRGIAWRVFSYLAYITIFTAMLIFLVPVLGRLRLASQVGTFVVTIGMIAVASLILGLIPMIQRWRAQHIARRIFVDDPAAPIPEMVARLMRARPWWSGPATMTALSRLLVGAGRTNIVIRMAGRRNFWPIRPTAWSFEPRPLDESDSTFAELADATAAENAESGFEFAPPDKLPFRAVRRNIRMKGGYFSLILISFFWCWDAYDFYVTGRPTIWLGVFTYLLYAKLFGRATGGPGAIMWSLVSRGLLLDMRKRRDAEGYRVYDRLRSVLVVFQSTRHTWTVSVADKLNRYFTVATSREVELLLRAWTSPVAPPSARSVETLLGIERQMGQVPEAVSADKPGIDTSLPRRHGEFENADE